VTPAVVGDHVPCTCAWSDAVVVARPAFLQSRTQNAPSSSLLAHNGAAFHRRERPQSEGALGERAVASDTAQQSLPFKVCISSGALSHQVQPVLAPGMQAWWSAGRTSHLVGTRPGTWLPDVFTCACEVSKIRSRIMDALPCTSFKASFKISGRLLARGPMRDELADAAPVPLLRHEDGRYQHKCSF
jgi:hypothetical protein